MADSPDTPFAALLEPHGQPSDAPPWTRVAHRLTRAIRDNRAVTSEEFRIWMCEFAEGVVPIESVRAYAAALAPASPIRAILQEWLRAHGPLESAELCQYQSDLKCLASPRADRQKEESLQAARRVFRFHKQHGLPWPGLALPCRRGQGQWPIIHPNRASRYFWPNVYHGERHTAEQFLSELGLAELLLEAKRDQPNGLRCDLGWDYDQGYWEIWTTPGRYGQLDGKSLGCASVPRWTLAELANVVELVSVLSSWSVFACPNDDDLSPPLAEALDMRITHHSIFRPLHELILNAIRPRERVLLGTKIVLADAKIRPGVLHAWRMCLAVRPALWAGQSVDAIPLPGIDPSAFRTAWIELHQRWPELATRARRSSNTSAGPSLVPASGSPRSFNRKLSPRSLMPMERP